MLISECIKLLQNIIANIYAVLSVLLYDTDNTTL